MFNRLISIIFLIFFAFLIIPISVAIDDNSSLYEDINNELNIGESSLDELHVDINGNDNNKGDVQNPLFTIKKAIDISSNNSKIIVHEGTYKENNLNINKSLEIQGHGNVIIDAENNNRIITINTASNNKVSLSGITFINGNSKQMAGAIYVLGAQTIINNCKFINNTAATEGGAIFWNSEQGILNNTLIENNYARDGSGVKWGESDTTLSIGRADYGQIINCTFKNNHIMQDDDACIGLAIYSNNVNIINSTFKNHKTRYNSSFEVLYINGDYSTVKGCSFLDNEMTMAGALGFDGNYVIAFNNTFINNTLLYYSSFGGAIAIQSETGNIYNNTFINNGGSKSKGGAIYINSVETYQFIFINITDNLFVNNKADLGAGVYADGNSNMLTLMINNNNFNEDYANIGSAIYLTNIYNPTTIKDNIYKNLFANMASGIYASSAIINLKNNSMIDCISKLGENIYSDTDINSNLKLKFNDIIAGKNQETTLTAILTDDMNNSISTTSISFKINNVNVNGTVGLNSIKTIFNQLGEFNISGIYEKGSVTVENGKLSVIPPIFINVEDTINYGKSVSIKVTLTNESQVLKNKEIVANFNGNDILLITDNEGIALFNTNLEYGKYTVNFRFEDNKYYKSSNKTISITVLNSISSKNLIRTYNSGIDFKAIFYNGDSLLKNTKVIFNVNGKNYKSITDRDGVAILNQKLNDGFYKIVITNPTTGDVNYNNLQIVKRITENKNINVYFTETAIYKIRIFNDNGSPVGSNEVVKVTVNKKTYNLKSDKNGYIVLKTKLNPGSYTVTATYKNVKVSNKITFKKILSAKNISKKKSRKIKFTAKLAKNKKPISGKKLKFKIKGKTYKVKTNKNGLAILTLKNLKKGKYTIYTYYNTCKIRNSIKIK